MASDPFRQKSDEELINFIEFMEERHGQARGARRAQGGRSTDTQMDKLMKDTLERMEKAEKEARRRGLF